MDYRLNPFEFRAGLKRKDATTLWPLCSLNPFEFRAGLKLKMAKLRKRNKRLNPFEFRAGLKLSKENRMQNFDVLIPLNSGLA